MTGLRQCNSVTQHQYPSHLNRCPYCIQSGASLRMPAAPRPAVGAPNSPKPFAVSTPRVPPPQGPSPLRPLAPKSPWKFPVALTGAIVAVATGVAGLGLLAAGSRPGTELQQPTTTASQSVGTADTAPEGSWVTVLASLDQDETTLAKARARARGLSTSEASVHVLDSTATPGLNPGYWALVLMPYASRTKAVAACATVGRSAGGTCYPRLIG